MKNYFGRIMILVENYDAAQHFYEKILDSKKFMSSQPSWA